MKMKSTEFPRFNGVLMKPGVRVYCHDRDDVCYDLEGTITAVIREGSSWSFDVSFDGPEGSKSNSPRQMSWYAVSPTAEETKSEDACQFRAEHSLRIFLCHASEDKPIVRTLHARLTALGFKPWLDEIDINPGVKWESEIEEAVYNSHVVLVFVSTASIKKAGFVQKEIYYALERALEMPDGTVFIMPVRLDECLLPKRLRKWQAVDLFTEQGEKRLIEALSKKAKEFALFPIT